jgi:class 3 adenylate cyclase/peroxiredoxin
MGCKSSKSVVEAAAAASTAKQEGGGNALMVKGESMARDQATQQQTREKNDGATKVADSQQPVEDPAVLEALGSLLPADVRLHFQSGSGAPDSKTVSLKDHTVLLLDAKGYTALTERFGGAPEKLTKLLNSVFGPIVDVVTRNGGSVERFAGDALVCIFYSPVDAFKCALHACFELCGSHDNEHGVTMHAALASGDLTVCYVGGSGGRWGRVVLGEVFGKLETALSRAGSGQVGVDPALWESSETVFQAEAMKFMAKVSKENKEVVLVEPFCSCDEVDVGHAVTDGEHQASGQLADSQMSSNPHMMNRALPSVAVTKALIDRQVHEYVTKGLDRYLSSVRMISCVFLFLGSHEVMTVEHLQADFLHIQEVLEKYEGFLGNFLADEKGVIAVLCFGWPLTHADDALRACRAAHELAVALPMSKVGVARGRAFCGFVGSTIRRETTVIGSGVNLSARLMTISQSGTPLCDASSFEACKGSSLRFGDQQYVRVKGRDDDIPVRIISGLGPSDDVVCCERAADEENALLAKMFPGPVEALENVMSVRHSAQWNLRRCVNLVGVSGQFQDRLVLSTGCKFGWKTVIVQADPYQKDRAFATASEVAQRLICGDFARYSSQQKLEVIKPWVSDPYELSLLNVVLKLELSPSSQPWAVAQMPEKRRIQQTAACLLGLLTKFVSDSTVLLLSDVGSCDRMSRLLMSEWLKGDRPLPFLFVQSALELPDLLDAARPEAAVNVSLPVFTSPACLEPLIMFKCHCSCVDGSLTAWLLEKSQGIAQLAEGILDDLLKNKHIEVETTSDMAVFQDLSRDFAFSLPSSVEDMARRKVDCLDPEVGVIAKLSAVLGTEFPVSLLRHCCSEEKLRNALPDFLQKLVVAGIITSTGNEIYRFVDRAVSDAAYSSLLPEDVMDVCKRAALFWETNGLSIESGSRVALLSSFWFGAVCYLPRSAGGVVSLRSDDVDTEKATTHLWNEYSLLIEIPDFASAVGPLERILRLVRDPLQRRDVLIQSAQCLTAVGRKGDVEVAMQRFREALSIKDASRLPKDSSDFDCWYGLWNLAFRSSAVLASLSMGLEDICSSLLTLAKDLQDPFLLVHAHRAAAISFWRLGRFSQVLAHVDDAFDAAASRDPLTTDADFMLLLRFGLRDPLTQTLLLGSRLRWIQGDFDMGSKMQEEGLSRSFSSKSIASDTGQLHDLAVACHNYGLYHKFAELEQTALRASEILKSAPSHLRQLKILFDTLVLLCKFERKEVSVDSLLAVVKRSVFPDHIVDVLTIELILRSSDKTHDGDCQAVCEECIEACERGQMDLLPELFRLHGLLAGRRLATVPEGDPSRFELEQKAEESLFRSLYLSASEHATTLEMRAARDLARLWLEDLRKNQKQALARLESALSKIKGENEEVRQTRDVLSSGRQLTLKPRDQELPMTEYLQSIVTPHVVKLFSEQMGESPQFIAEKLTAMMEEMETIKEEIESRPIPTGSPAPDFEVVSVAGTRLKLSELLQAGPVILSFKRGFFCMHCQGEIELLTDALPTLEAYGATVIAIIPSGADQFIDKFHPRFHIVNDPTLALCDLYHLSYEIPPVCKATFMWAGIRPDLDRGAPDDWRTALPATYIINESGNVLSAKYFARWDIRMSLDEIRDSLKVLHEEKQQKLREQRGMPVLHDILSADDVE